MSFFQKDNTCRDPRFRPNHRVSDMEHQEQSSDQSPKRRGRLSRALAVKSRKKAKDHSEFLEDTDLDNDEWALLSPSSSKALQNSQKSLPPKSRSPPADREKLPSEISFVQCENTKREMTSQRSSKSSDWSFVDTEPAEEQQNLKKIDSATPQQDLAKFGSQEYQQELGDLAQPFIVVQPPSEAGTTDDPCQISQEEESKLFSAEFRGARSYWQQPPSLDSLTEGIRDLKIAHRESGGAMREHFQNQEQELMDMRKERWGVEASRDQVEQHIDEVKQERTPEDDERARKKREEIAHMRNYLAGPQDEIWHNGMNARDQAIFNNRGKTAQAERMTLAPASYLQSAKAFEHPKTNRRGDFAYKEGSFIHKKIEPMFNERGARVGWNHKHMPSYKRREVASKLHGEKEMQINLGKLPVEDRLPMLVEGATLEPVVVSRAQGQKYPSNKWEAGNTERSIQSWSPTQASFTYSMSDGQYRHDSASANFDPDFDYSPGY